MLKVFEISKSFNRKKVLNNINFDVNPGSIITILGENGAGKTTLIKIMLGLLEQCQGKIYFNQKEIGKNKNEYKKNIGSVLEGNRNSYWYLSAWENIYYFGSLLGISKKELAIRGQELLILFELDGVANEKVGTYSRGMQQKLAIIISLLNNPKILFLDEPTLGLDVKSRNKLIEYILKIKNTGSSIILTTHQLEIVEEISDEIYFLKDGNLLKNSDKEMIEASINENIVEISLEKRKKIKLTDGEHIQNMYVFLLEQNEKIISINKRRKKLEEIFIEIYREKDERYF